MGLIELLAAMFILTVAIGGLLGVFVASTLSLTRSNIKGTALTIADRQLEAYRAMPYECIVINGGTPPPGQLYCPNSLVFPNAYASDQTVPASESADHRTYQVHTDIVYATVDQKEKQVTVVVSTPAGRELARASTLFSAEAFGSSGP
jgi:type II secretory pathway pseudopilin PulG